MKYALIVAGSDPSAGAGIAADIVTLKDFNVPFVFTITALTAQNENRFLTIHPTSVDVFTQQLSAACEGKEIVAAKVGMIGELALVRALVWFLSYRKISHLVIDPMLHSSSGASLLEKKAYAVYRQQLLPLATVITPNLPEAESLVGSRIYNEETQEKAAKKIFEEMMQARGGKFPDRLLAVIVKGGHMENEAVDLLYDGSTVKKFRHVKIPGPSPRGTGCRFASALTAGLVRDKTLEESVQQAKDYLVQYIRRSSLNHAKI